MYYRSELYHHGILGMKWGVRRYQPYPVESVRKGREIGQAAKVQQRNDKLSEKYKQRVTKKFEKIDTKIEKQKGVADKLYAKAEKKSVARFFTNQEKIDKAFGAATEAQRRVHGYEYKGGEYYKKYLTKYGKIGVDMAPDLRKIGERYLENVANNTNQIYQISLARNYATGRKGLKL